MVSACLGVVRRRAGGSQAEGEGLPGARNGRRLRVNRQTDFTYLRIGLYYVPPLLDDFSRFIVDWKLCGTMKEQDLIFTPSRRDGSTPSLLSGLKRGGSWICRPSR
jgi:transposase InsO family protein